jgi:hypothetical protein
MNRRPVCKTPGALKGWLSGAMLSQDSVVGVTFIDFWWLRGPCLPLTFYCLSWQILIYSYKISLRRLGLASLEKW